MIELKCVYISTNIQPHVALAIAKCDSIQELSVHQIGEFIALIGDSFFQRQWPERSLCLFYNYRQMFLQMCSICMLVRMLKICHAVIRNGSDYQLKHVRN